jgi:hypothetical protein
MDLGSYYKLQSMKIDFSGGDDGYIASSVDGLNFINVTGLKPYISLKSFRSIPMKNITARYIQLTYLNILYIYYLYGV